MSQLVIIIVVDVVVVVVVDVCATRLGIDTICFLFQHIMLFIMLFFFAEIMLKNMLFALNYAKLI